MSAMLVMDLFLAPTLPRTMSRLDVFEPKVSAHCQAKNCCKLECHSASFEISLDRMPDRHEPISRELTAIATRPVQVEFFRF
jgi:hypothetical protein